MKFRFPLQKIVDLKGNEKTQAEWLLAQSLVILRDEEQSLSDLVKEIENHQTLLSRSSENPISIVDIQFLQEYITHLEKLVERKLADVHNARLNVQSKQSLLMDRSIDEKVWLKTREKAFNLFTVTMLKKDQQDMDEMASTRHINK